MGGGADLPGVYTRQPLWTKAQVLSEILEYGGADGIVGI